MIKVIKKTFSRQIYRLTWSSLQSSFFYFCEIYIGWIKMYNCLFSLLFDSTIQESKNWKQVLNSHKQFLKIRASKRNWKTFEKPKHAHLLMFLGKICSVHGSCENGGCICNHSHQTHPNCCQRKCNKEGIINN